MFKKIFFVIITLFTLIFAWNVKAQEENEVNLYFFWSKSCPHCAKEESFIQKILPRYPYLEVHDYEVSTGLNAVILQKVGRELGIETAGVPITIVGNSHFIGYLNDETTGKTLTEIIEETYETGDPDPVGKIINPTKEEAVNQTPEPQFTPEPTLKPVNEMSEDNQSKIPEKINLPVLGEISTKEISLPFLTIIVAAMDGFNPCAMWVLLFLISMLLGMNDRKRMFILGTAFIFSSALVYFLFLSAWLNLFLFIGFIVWVRIGIGILALGTGSWYLYDFYKNRSGSCKVTGSEKRQKIFEKIRNITQNKKLALALAGIILLAFAVNLIELVCSAGLPAIYTKILSMSQLKPLQYYGYLILYIFIFMLDDLLIFFGAMATLQATGIQQKYSRFSRLVGGILIFVIGILLLFRPEILMFG